MKVQGKVLLMMACLILAIPMMAGAARYKGDGATQNVANGGWDLPLVSPAHSGGTDTYCLECHGSGANQYNCSGNCLAPDKSSYLKHGHKNILRKVTPGAPWAGPDGTILKQDSNGSALDWTNGNITLSDGAHQLFYVLGWVPSPYAVFDKDKDGKTATVNLHGASMGYTCGSCHTTGYTATGSNSDGTILEPAKSFPTITSGVTGKWWFDGIQCERCHKDNTNDYGGHNCYINGVLDPTKTKYADCAAAGGTYSVNVPTGASSTALCAGCHPGPAAWENSANNPNYSAQPVAYPLGASATSFSSHTTSKQFLNSPHARFTGTFSQEGTTTPGLYNSHFSDGTCSAAGEFLKKADCEAAGGTWTSFQGGCTTCHDVHQSTLPEINAEPMKRECGITCHASRADFTKINHPSGTGTPMEGGAPEACVICHMPLSAHVFRISTDPNYSTFPKLVGGILTPGICSDPSYTTKAACDAAGKAWSGVANSAPEGTTYANAVWVDLDLACGQCHGGGADGSGAKIYPLTKAQLAVYAQGMHDGVSPNQPPVLDHTSIVINGMTASFTDNSTAPGHQQSQLEVTVNWGDWSVSTQKAGTTFTHTYNRAGKYKATCTVKEPGGLKDGHKMKITIPKQ